MRLDDRVAIVTGSGRGIGREYALGLAQEGARVCVAELRQDAAEAVVKEIQDQGGEAIAVKTDVADAASVGKMVQACVDAFGGVDILVNNAAIFATDTASGYDPVSWTVLDGSLDQWHEMMTVNVESVILTTRAVFPSMKARGRGKIINQSSIGAFVDSGVYGFTKLLVAALTRESAVQLAPFHINVNAIAPGVIATGAVKYRGDRSEQEGAVDIARMVNGEYPGMPPIPWGRAGEPRDLVGLAVFLASDDSEYVSGQTIFVDGAWIRRL